jgi:hypothetical protein
VLSVGPVGPGAIQGTYSGVGAQATVGVGLGANVLVGGDGRSISLQPLSLEGQTGAEHRRRHHLDHAGIRSVM